MSFEKEYVINQNILCSLPTYEGLDMDIFETFQNGSFHRVDSVIKKKYKPKEGNECKCGEIFSTHLQLETQINRVHLRLNVIVCSECG